MRRHRWAFLLSTIALAVAAAVFTVGYASAGGTQQQGVPRKLYVASNPTFTLTGVLGTNWTAVPQLQAFGTWEPGDLLVAHVDAGTTCVTTGKTGQCRVRIGLTGLDPGAPNYEFQPVGADTFAMDTAVGPTGASQAHGVTRYLVVPAPQPGTANQSTPLVWVEVEVSNPDVRFTLDLSVLTVEITKPTVT